MLLLFHHLKGLFCISQLYCYFPPLKLYLSILNCYPRGQKLVLQRCNGVDSFICILVCIFQVFISLIVYFLNIPIIKRQGILDIKICKGRLLPKARKDEGLDIQIEKIINGIPILIRTNGSKRVIPFSIEYSSNEAILGGLQRIRQVEISPVVLILAILVEIDLNILIYFIDMAGIILNE